MVVSVGIEDGPSGSTSRSASREFLGSCSDLVTVHVAVSDTGIGVSDDLKLLLFQGFTQAHGSMSRRYGGTGTAALLAAHGFSNSTVQTVPHCMSCWQYLAHHQGRTVLQAPGLGLTFIDLNLCRTVHLQAWASPSAKGWPSS